MINVIEWPRCICGYFKWQFEMGEISTDPLAIGSQFFHCPACKRMAAQHGIKDSCIQVFLISRASCELTEGFSEKVSEWVGSEVQGLIDEECLANTDDIPISISNPDPENYIVYTPNERGNWVEVK